MYCFILSAYHVFTQAVTIKLQAGARLYSQTVEPWLVSMYISPMIVLVTITPRINRYGRQSHLQTELRC